MQLIIDEKLKQEKWHEKDKISGIYLITNLVNQKKYVGHTGNIRKRFADYNGKKYLINNRPIYLAIRKYGQENFKFEILQLVDGGAEALGNAEKEFIALYGTMDPNKGYNIEKGGQGATEVTRKRMSEAHKGLVDSASTKRKKSNAIIMVHLEKKIVILSDSAKLAGDYLGKSKDYIKNCLRHPSSLQGFRFYYDDFIKRLEILRKMYKKRSIRDKEYVAIAEFFNELELSGESVETIYDKIVEKYGPIYQLSYDNESVSLEEYHLPPNTRGITG